MLLGMGGRGVAPRGLVAASGRRESEKLAVPEDGPEAWHAQMASSTQRPDTL